MHIRTYMQFVLALMLLCSIFVMQRIYIIFPREYQVYGSLRQWHQSAPHATNNILLKCKYFDSFGGWLSCTNLESTNMVWYTEKFNFFFFVNWLGINYGIVEIKIHIRLIVLFEDKFMRLETKTYKVLNEIMQMSNLFFM